MDELEFYNGQLTGAEIDGLPAAICRHIKNPAGVNVNKGEYVFYNGGLYKANAAISYADYATAFTSKLDAVTIGGLNDVIKPVDISSAITPASGVTIARAFALGNFVYIAGTIPKITTANANRTEFTMSKYKPSNTIAVGQFQSASTGDNGYGSIGIGTNGTCSSLYSKTTTYGLYFSIWYYTVDL